MPVSDYFSASYTEARGKFRAAAEAGGAHLTAYRLQTHRGPSGDALSIDVAVIGSAMAQHGLLLISGTHGVEGFCGSGCQVGFFVDRLHEALPADGVAVLVHALNPYGFAWLRRVNEDGVDLNRNFVDFTQALPAAPTYEALHDALVPAEWEGPARLAADAALEAYVREHGPRPFQAAVTRGQYTHATGLFYCCNCQSWSVKTIRRIVKRPYIPPSVESLAVFDLHTGLGPPGYGEPILIGEAPEDFPRAVKWYGPDVTNLAGGKSVSAELVGTLYRGVRDSVRSKSDLHRARVRHEADERRAHGAPCRPLAARREGPWHAAAGHDLAPGSRCVLRRYAGLEGGDLRACRGYDRACRTRPRGLIALDQRIVCGARGVREERPEKVVILGDNFSDEGSQGPARGAPR